MKEYRFEEIRELKYGENPHQTAGLYKCDDMVDYEVLYGKPLSYDNILNLNEITQVLSEFYDVCAAVIMKHAAYCGVALGSTILEAYNKAFDCDPVSAFYGTMGFTRPVDVELARYINSMEVKLIVAPDFEPEAIEFLKSNSAIKLVKINTPLKDFKKLCMEEIKMTPFGVLIQEKNTSELDKDLFKVVTKTKPSKEQIEDAIFAWKVVKHAKTDAAVIAKDFATLGISQKQPIPSFAVEEALKYACDGSKDAILATDGIIHSHGAIYAAVQGRVAVIIQPGGSPVDSEIVNLADKYGVAMIMTGVRNHKY